MAERQQLKMPVPVLLGFIDEEISRKYASSINYRTSKIGGLPDWYSGLEHPVCSVCCAAQVLILQVYAPVQSSSDHRTLYVFACLTPACWGAPHSWSCIRIQSTASPVPEVGSKARSVTSSGDIKSKSSGFFEVGDNWGSDSDDDDDDDDNVSDDHEDDNNGNNNNTDNSNSAAPLQHYNTQQHSNINLNLNLNSNEQMSTSPPGYIEQLGNSNINRNKRNVNSATATIMDTEDSSATIAMHLLNLNQGNGNGGSVLAAGAVGVAGGSTMEQEEATAVIEGAEGDMVAVDSPEVPSRDITMWFKTPSQAVPGWTRAECLRSYFLNCDEEQPPKCGDSNSMSSHERELLHRYTQRQGQHNSSGGSEEGAGDGVYVKGVPAHGDLYMQKFKKKVAHAPDQVLRYCRESSSGPLLLRPLLGLESGARCRGCKAPLMFELQLMPQLIPYLQAQNNSNTNIPNIPCSPSATRSIKTNHERITSKCEPANVTSNVNEASPRHCKSTRSKHAASKTITHSSESTESVDTQESMDSCCSGVPHTPNIKVKGHPHNQNEFCEMEGATATTRELSSNSKGNTSVLNAGMLLSGVVEYGTVLVYTCSQSCWHGQPVHEIALVQPELL